jgi:ferrous iron transport protein A
MFKEKDQKVLNYMEDGHTGTIVSIAGGKKAAKRMADLGLAPGTAIKVVRKALFSGPLQIEVCGSRLVLGYGLVSKIIVELI